MDRDDGVLVSIIIVNSDGREDTLNCLDSIYRYPPSDPFEVILVDNASSEPIQPSVEQAFPDVIQIPLSTKQGFSKNYNLGMRAAAGDYLLILNNDTLLEESALDHLVRFLADRPSFGVVGPMLLSSAGEIEPVCARKAMTFSEFILEQLVFDLRMPLGRVRRQLQRKKLEKMKSGVVECISGACMLVSREAMDKVGFLDERFDFYFEDIEWCRRFRERGYQVAYVRESRVVHLGDRSLSRVRYWAKQSEFKGALLYFSRYGGLGRMRLGILRSAVLMGYVLRASVFSVLGRFLDGPDQSETYRRLITWLRGQPGHVLIKDIQQGQGARGA